MIESNQPKKKREKDRIRSEKIERLSAQLKRRTITIENFLYEMSKEDSKRDESYYDSSDEEDEESNDSGSDETDDE